MTRPVAQCALILVAFGTALAVLRKRQKPTSEPEEQDELRAWIVSLGGFICPKLRVNRRGLFASAPLDS